MSTHTPAMFEASDRDDRKSAALAEARLAPMPGARRMRRFAAARQVLRSPEVSQAGAAAEITDLSKPDEVSFFFLDGEKHRKRRAGVAGLFAPKAIATRHRAVMERTMDTIVADLQRRGSAPLDELSWQMAVNVAAEIIGLTDSDSNTNLAMRVKAVLQTSMRRPSGFLSGLAWKLKVIALVQRFYSRDLVPAIKARKREPREDVISYMIKENYSKRGMIMECMSYAGAGMMTTREYIVMAAWHLFDSPELLGRFLSDGEETQFAILEEILRLEPVASLLHRRARQPVPLEGEADVTADELVCIDIRAANTDEAITGACPHRLDPDRAKRMKAIGSYMSFGDGPHRCPGAQVALHETRMFLDRLLRLPGIRLESAPEILWNDQIQGYELRGAVVACDPA